MVGNVKKLKHILKMRHFLRPTFSGRLLLAGMIDYAVRSEMVNHRESVPRGFRDFFVLLIGMI